MVIKNSQKCSWYLTTGGGWGLANGAVLERERGGAREGRSLPPRGFGTRLVTIGCVSVKFLDENEKHLIKGSVRG